MNRHIYRVLACSVVLAAAPILGEQITVENASFEDHVLAAGSWTLNGIGLDHWTVQPGGEAGVWNVDDLTDFPGGAPDGVNVAYSSGPTISQILSAVVVEGMTYHLSVEVGKSPYGAFPGYGVQLLADGLVLAEDTNFNPPEPGTFDTVHLVYTSPTGDPSAGDAFEIRLLSQGAEVAFDDVSLTASEGSYPDWEMVDFNDKFTRVSSATAYDTNRGVVVAFGGRDTYPGTAMADTWEFDGEDWAKVATAHAPPARFWHTIVYDSHRQRTVLFGGGDPDNTIYFNDTWEYDGNDWQQIATAQSPDPRFVKSMAFDNVRNRTVLVGGQSNAGGFTDTWEYDGTDWTMINTPVSPPPPWALAAMAFDSERQKMVLTFHEGGTRQDTWEYDGSTWVEVSTANAPPLRWAHAMAYDESSKRVVLFGGYAPDFNGGQPMNDTWEYDGVDWTFVATAQSPWQTEQHTLTYDPATGQILMTDWAETWTYTSPEIFLDGFEAGTGPWTSIRP